MFALQDLQARRLISVVASGNGLIGYRFCDTLYTAYEALDQALLRTMARHVSPMPHSCTTLIERETLEKIGFFNKLPCIPMTASPHACSDHQHQDDGAWVLSPSTCYHTFSHLAGSTERWDLKCFTALGNCHRYEPVLDEPTRLGSFTMREFVLLGSQVQVEHMCQVLFDSGVQLIKRLVPSTLVERASDVFYGESASVTRKVQLAMGVKLEVLIPWPQRKVSVGSRNLHRDLFTQAFKIGPQAPEPLMHSACVAFGMERLLLSLLAQIGEPEALLTHLREVLDDQGTSEPKRECEHADLV
ncbi:hypothetical protein PSE10B_51320 [Pseudomonas amygdali pv. eriobotryae]|uniref:hypothetical protein n=1 Tax=Pseudomonas TaxID=286 RepID=UPI0016773F26|nr:MULTISPECIES: hypothetical protein [Pseudomonas]GFZ68610.1 hypothetical protein PSE10B_51320 [Pseudomonas amygdali pv. eriobotryae]